jgi:hypothetical protein
VAADIRQDMKVVSDAMGVFSLKVPANSKFRLVTFEDDAMMYMPTSDNNEITVGTTDITDALTFACSSSRSGAARIANDLGVDLDNILQRGYCAVNAADGDFPAFVPIGNITATVTTPGYGIVAGMPTAMGIVWMPLEDMSATSPISLFAVVADNPITGPTDVSITFTDMANDPPNQFGTFTCHVTPGFAVFSRQVNPTN